MATLDVWSDFACPWCFLGKRRLDRALVGHVGPSVEVRWRTFLLRPDLPPEGVDPRRELSRRFGGDGHLRQIFEKLRVLGREEEIEFDLEHMHGPHMGLAHEVAAVGQDMAQGQPNVISSLIDSLFSAQFEAGVFLGRLEDITEFLHTRKLGLDVAELADRVGRGEGKAQVRQDLEQAESLGVSGVPLFVKDHVLAVSGAQPSAVFMQYLAAAT